MRAICAPARTRADSMMDAVLFWPTANCAGCALHATTGAGAGAGAGALAAGLPGAAGAGPWLAQPVRAVPSNTLQANVHAVIRFIGHILLNANRHHNGSGRCRHPEARRHRSPTVTTSAPAQESEASYIPGAGRGLPFICRSPLDIPPACNAQVFSPHIAGFFLGVGGWHLQHIEKSECAIGFMRLRNAVMRICGQHHREDSTASAVTASPKPTT